MIFSSLKLARTKNDVEKAKSLKGIVKTNTKNTWVQTPLLRKSPKNRLLERSGALLEALMAPLEPFLGLRGGHLGSILKHFEVNLRPQKAIGSQKRKSQKHQFYIDNLMIFASRGPRL